VEKTDKAFIKKLKWEMERFDEKNMIPEYLEIFDIID
jgi:hypothetical protein